MKPLLTLLLTFLLATATYAQGLPGLSFSELPKRWDEGIPLGNGQLGSLVWQKHGRLRMSLDRADLWDNREALDMSKMTFAWVQEKLKLNQYDSVHATGDRPYDVVPYPTKIPAAALEWNIDVLGPVAGVRLDTKTAKCFVKWVSGTQMESFVAATQTAGWFRFTHIPANASVAPELMAPSFHPDSMGANGGPVEGASLQRLGYAAGRLQKNGNAWTYHQPISQGMGFTVSVRWAQHGDTLTGCWTVQKDGARAHALPDPTFYHIAEASHERWWNAFWAGCTLHLPDSVMERQWYMDKYKLGSVARRGAPPITLQAVWTADEGRLPPWKGDVHNDLNTQQSYWPVFSGNYWDGAASFTDWLWNIKPTSTKYTRHYFGTGGLNVPGVCTLDGVPMGGWIQYSMGPTVGAWVAQYFHSQWLYWPDSAFLRTRAYPYVSAVATYLEQITRTRPGVKGRFLPLSSSPEFFDNSTKAWFHDNTNFDQSLMTALFRAAAVEATALGKAKDAAHWQGLADEMAPLATDSTGLMLAPGEDQEESHRHMSPFMAIYPLGLLNPDNEADKTIIDRTLANISSLGTRAWCGYSFSWAGCLFARDNKGDSAARYLKIFATNFCSPNSFHLNGDQKGGMYSDFTYRPFTLEGNFAYAAGIQEMLLQSYKGYIEIFPAIPADWKNVSFHHLRAQGGFLVDAKMEDGKHIHIHIQASQPAVLQINVPGRGALTRQMRAGETIDLDGQK